MTGAMAKKMIGMMAAAAAAAMVTMLADIPRTESLKRDDNKTYVADRSRTAMADPSAMRNPISRVRRRARIPDLACGRSNTLILGSEISAIV